MAQSSRTWLVRRLDDFLSESLRQASPLELGRARLLVGICLGLLVDDLLILLQLLLHPGPRVLLAVAVVCSLCFGAALVLLRRAASTRPLSLLLCSVLTVGTIISSLDMKSLVVATHASIMLVPVVSVYLLGWRLGLLFSTLVSVNVGLVFPLYSASSLVSPGDRMMCTFAALYVLCAWGVGWLFISARDQAQVKVERTMETLRQSELKLIDLIESTDDLVVSLDAQGRVLTSNEAARQLFRRAVGRELEPGRSAFEENIPGGVAYWTRLLGRTLGGERVREEVVLPVPGRSAMAVEVTISPMRDVGGVIAGVTIFGRDITARKEADARLSEMHRNLLEVSRQAGMAEIATGVLHNVGNALNSVNVSASVVTERLRGLHVSGIFRTVELLDEHKSDLGTFLTRDPKGRQVPDYLKALSRTLAKERDAVLEEVHTLCKSVEHIKAVVSMQQQHARSTDMEERLSVSELLDDALRLHAVSFERMGIQLRREYAPGLVVWADRHKLLQILLNLLNNARHALMESDRPDKQLILRVEQEEGGTVRIEVADNGVGVAPDVLPRLFTQGFTTKKNGHGFGLHISAVAAEEMRGSLSCASAGRGQGATFTLELPAGGPAAGAKSVSSQARPETPEAA